jgi:hypothetical protein
MAKSFVLIASLSLTLMFSSCKNEKTSEEAATAPIPELKTTKIEFEESEFEFGEVNEGDTVRHEFIFKNTGEEPLLISDAKGSCGCTTPHYTKDTIAPGATGKMMVQFNSNGRDGIQEKTVTILANTEPEATVIKIKGKVKKKPEVIEGPFIKK